MVSADIRKEERAYIMGSQSMIIVQILPDLETEFGKSYFRRLETNDVLISETCCTSVKFAHNLKEGFKTTLLDIF